jgi:glycosyltransferase involved in cell wall biosynthesis
VTQSLRILYHHRTAADDGMRVHIEQLIAAMRARGHEVLVVGPPGSETGGSLEGLIDRLRLHLPAFLFEILELAYNIPAYLRLVRAARIFRPDIIYERYNLYLLAGLVFKWLHGVPAVLEINAPLAAERAAFGGLSMPGLARACQRILWRGCDVALPVTEVLAEMVRKVRGAARDTRVVPNGAVLDNRGTPDAALAVRRQLGIAPRDVVLGFVGFVRPWHGVEWAVDALAGLPPHVHLVIVGDGPALPILRDQAAARGLAARVHFTGRVSHFDIAVHMRAFDVALQPAAVAYASPLKLFEYMALGRAVLAPDQPNLREILTDGEDALLFAAGDAAAFTKALVRLCQDDDLRLRLGEAARRTVERVPFTWAKNAERIEAMAYALISADPATGAPSSAAAAS